ncbi:AhpC/TSA family protein [Chitinophaga polysaccharea]|uniref:TlpA family protein disulfide reductase n=1 Tax=Chitinophaga TaxID=79328 RepID=UPI0014554CD6|nr:MULTISPECIES: TlpA disulfide reductase family protein [Chitinophaga]NLR61128.1 AhpC/TSA family protein [Chitinophaga polysaccharea]NLU94966.1 AhpC/TSA family protein [Chitinophaga sp. Ak27]
MIKIRYSACCALLLFLLRLPGLAQGFEIKGAVKDVKYGKIKLLALEDNKVVLGEADIKGHQFIVKGKLDYPQPVTLCINGNVTRVFLENTRYQLQTDYFGLNGHQLQGGQLNAEYQYYLQDMTNPSNPDRTREFLAKYPDSEVGAFLANYWGKYPYSRVKAFLDAMGPHARRSWYGKLVTQREDVMARSQPGRVVPDFKALGANGDTVNYNRFRGKVLMLDFWASWCHPCRMEIPHLKKVYQTFHEKGVEILSISVDAVDAAWKKALGQEQMPWPQARDPKGFDENGFRKVFGFGFVPFAVIIGADGKVVTVWDRTGKSLEQLLEEALAQTK